MNAVRDRRPGLIIMAAGVWDDAPTFPAEFSRIEGEISYSRWDVDETVVALTRAAINHGLRLAVPLDEEFAPLVAQVAAEYATPPVAEGENSGVFGERNQGNIKAVSFYRMKRSRNGGGRGAVPGWARPFIELNILSEYVSGPEDLVQVIFPRALVGIGEGPAVETLMKRKSLAGIPHHRLLWTADQKSRRRQKIAVYESELEQRLQASRSKLKLFVPEGIPDQRREEGEAEAPPFFHAYPPLALYAQYLVENLTSERQP